MEAGPELDELVAKKVMGLEYRRWVPYGAPEGWFPKDHPPCCPPAQNSDIPLGHNHLMFCPAYSTSIEDAWQVFHAISVFGSGRSPIGDMKHPTRNDRSAFYKPVIRLEYYEHDGCVEVRIGRCKGVEYADDVVVNLIGAENQIPYAICLAALKAVGEEIDV